MQRDSCSFGKYKIAIKASTTEQNKTKTKMKIIIISLKNLIQCKNIFLFLDTSLLFDAIFYFNCSLLNNFCFPFYYSFLLLSHIYTYIFLEYFNNSFTCVLFLDLNEGRIVFIYLPLLIELVSFYKKNCTKSI